MAASVLNWSLDAYVLQYFLTAVRENIKTIPDSQITKHYENIYFHALSVPKITRVRTGPDSTDRRNAYYLQYFVHARMKNIIASVPESVPETTPKYIKTERKWQISVRTPFGF